MADYKALITAETSLPEPRVGLQEACWYAVYTCARHEKRVSAELTHRELENYLPLYEAVHKWKDRHQRVEMPLFPGYLFVHISLSDRLQVLQVPGVVRLIGFNGQAAPLDSREIETLRSGLLKGPGARPHPYLAVGRRVRIRSGAFQGLGGILIRQKGALRVVISIHLIQRSVAVEVDSADLQPV